MTINKINHWNTFYFVLIAIFLILMSCTGTYKKSYDGTIEDYLNRGTKESSSSTPGYSDSLTLKNGQTITNVKTKIAGDSVVVDYPDGSTKVFKKAQVKAVNRN